MDERNEKPKTTKYTGINKLFRLDFLQTLLDKWYDGTFTDFFDDWKWIFSFSKKYKGIIVFYTVFGLVGSTLSLGSAWLSKILINIIVEKQTENLWLLVFAAVFSLVFSLVIGSVLSRIGLKISIYVNNDIQSEIFGKIIDAEWKELNKYPNGDLLNRFGSDTGTVAGNAIGWIPRIIISLYSFAATFWLLFKTDPNMAWIALGSAPVLLIMSRFIMRKMREYKKRILELNSAMTSFEVDTFYNFDMIKSFGVSGTTEKKLKRWQGKYRDYNLDYNKFEIKANIGVSLLQAAVSALAFGYCLWRLWSGQILYGDMAFFLQQRSALSSRFNLIVGTVPGMVSSAISAHRIRELVDLPKEKHDPESRKKLAALAGKGLTVKMNDVSFSYDGEKTVYEHGCFEAKPGEIVAVLGPSGEGKTTMLRLLLGLIHPSEGSVTISDSEGNEVPMNADLRPFFSYVPQGNSIMAGTIADNMRLVDEDATDEQIIEALKTACAWEFVSRHPDGINGRVGERGQGLSEGQAQRIAIARAVLRDAPIILLDEATSALDTETEKRVLENILYNSPEKTCIVSTHRKSILRHCKRVYFIQNKQAQEFNMRPVEEIPEEDD
ncbi:MAG: ABC transporter ATP-binding protein [Firmicutes bacterium]|nr:ABC transporter ATP-binding protein [Candidatus Colimorpha enterica]